MIKLIAVDMDGTLLDSNKALQEETIQAVSAARQAGIEVVLATGRSLPGILPYVAQLTAATDLNYAIVNNGATTHRVHSWDVLDGHTFNYEDLEQFYHFNAQFQTDLTLFDEQHYFCLSEQPNARVVQDSKFVFSDITSIVLSEEIAQKNIYNVMFVGEPEDVDVLEQAIPASWYDKYSLVRSQAYLFEIMPKEADKGQALARLCQRLNVSASEVMALGDGSNDAEMLRFAGHSVAMGNASDALKAISRYTTATNDAHGVAQAIYQIALSKH